MRLDHILHRQVRVARVFGIPVRIDYRWFIVFALSTWLLAENFQRGLWEVQLNDTAALVVAVVTTLLLFLSVFGHELSHALAAQGEGIEIEEIVLHPFGGLARLKREPDSPRAEFRIAVAGPAASFIFALVGYGAMYLTDWGRSATWAVCAIIAGGNLMLAIFNLLPGYPLDGGRVMRSYLWHRSGQLDQATRTVSRFGQLIALTIVVFGVYMAYTHGAYFMALWSVLVGLFLWDAARAVWRAHAARHAHTVADAMSAPFALEPDTLVSHFIDAVLPQHRQESFAVARERRLHGILTLADLKKLPRELWHKTRVREVMRPVEPRLFVAPQTPLPRAFELMKHNGAGALAVIDDAGELVGFLQRGRLKPRPDR
ncbi:MAG TPA: site-2 protease family protein [Pyrinomonadaceae bacterium]|jgi:Zn-dependent protease